MARFSTSICTWIAMIGLQQLCRMSAQIQSLCLQQTHEVGHAAPCATINLQVVWRLSDKIIDFTLQRNAWCTTLIVSVCTRRFCHAQVRQKA